MSEMESTVSDSSQPFEEMLGLASLHCDGTISPTQKARLEELLIRDPELRRRFLAFLRVHAELMWMYRTGDGSRDMDVAPASSDQYPADQYPADRLLGLPSNASGTGDRSVNASPNRQSFLRGLNSWQVLAGVLATATIVLLLLRLSGPSDSRSRSPQMVDQTRDSNPLSSHEFIATLLSSSTIVWSESGDAIDVGDRVTLGKIKTESGESEWLFDSGAKLILSGPAEMELRTPLSAFLHRGTLVAHMPESAIGFQLETESAELVDQGTEFGVLANPDGTTEVHVFRGQVDVLGKSRTKNVELFTGDAVRKSSRAEPGTSIPFSRERFGGLDQRIASPVQWPTEEGGNGHYYQLVVSKTPVTWHEAARDSMGRFHHGMQGHLVTVNSAAEDNFLVRSILDRSAQRGIWIGLTDVLKESQFCWITGEPLEFTNWASFPAQQPDNYQEADWHGGEDYGMYTKFPGHQPWAWNDLSVDSIHEKVSAYLVEFEPAIPSKDHRSLALPPVCWEKSNGGNGHHYQLVLSLESVAWETVQQQAEKASWNRSQGHLASLETVAEQNFVIENLLQNSGISENLIGLSGNKDSELRWITDQPFDRPEVGKPFFPAERVYGLLFWDGRLGEWTIQTRAKDALPAAWFGYVIEFP